MDDCFHKLATIDYSSKDEKFMSMAFRAVNWLQDLKKKGSEWQLYPKPTREELYPNMKNHSDDPWHQQKLEIAKRLNDITMIWYCKHTNRKSCFNRNIYTWTDPRCTTDTLGIKGKIIGPIINRILNVNRDPNIWILPENLKQLPNEFVNTSWLEMKKGDFYVDFEFISMVDNGIESFPASKVEGLVYLIGTGYFDNKNQWRYKSFLSKRLTAEEEKHIFHNWLEFLSSECKKLNIDSPRLLHWGCAESTWFDRHTNKISHAALATLKINMINVLEEIKKQPITVKGAFGLVLRKLVRPYLN